MKARRLGSLARAATALGLAGLFLSVTATTFLLAATLQVDELLREVDSRYYHPQDDGLRSLRGRVSGASLDGLATLLAGQQMTCSAEFSWEPGEERDVRVECEPPGRLEVVSYLEAYMKQVIRVTFPEKLSVEAARFDFTVEEARGGYKLTGVPISQEDSIRNFVIWIDENYLIREQEITTTDETLRVKFINVEIEGIGYVFKKVSSEDAAGLMMRQDVEASRSRIGAYYLPSTQRIQGRLPEVDELDLSLEYTYTALNGRALSSSETTGTELVAVIPSSSGSTPVSPTGSAKPAGGEGGSAVAEAGDPQEPLESDYVVQPGDTFYTIAQRLKGDGSLWREIWAWNPQIEDPDLLRVGERIHTVDPATVIAKKEPEEKETEKPEESQQQPQQLEVADTFEDPSSEGGYVIAADEFVGEPTTAIEPELVPKEEPHVVYSSIEASGFLASDEVEKAGAIVTSYAMHHYLIEGDDVYVSLGAKDKVEVNDLYSVFEPVRPLRHPRTGRKIGTVVQEKGLIRITEVERKVSKAVLLRSHTGVERGDKIKPYLPIEDRIVLRPASCPVEGFIVAEKKGSYEIGVFDTVYMDRGEKQGLEVGNTFLVYRKRVEGRSGNGFMSMEVPVDVIGEVVVVRTRPETSTAYVTRSNTPIHPGDRVRTGRLIQDNAFFWDPADVGRNPYRRRAMGCGRR